MATHLIGLTIMVTGFTLQAGPVVAQLKLSAATECPSNAAMEPCMARAKAMLASRQNRKATEYLEPACIRGAKLACDDLWPVFLDPKYGLRDGARFYSVFEASCRAGVMGSCQDGALVASASSSAAYANAYKDYSRVRTFGDPGCMQNRMEACYGLMMLYVNADSRYRNSDQAILYARKVCDIGEVSGCTMGSEVIQKLPKADIANGLLNSYS